MGQFQEKNQAATYWQITTQDKVNLAANVNCLEWLFNSNRDILFINVLFWEVAGSIFPG